MDTVVSIEDGVKDKGGRMEVGLQNTLYFLLVNAAKFKFNFTGLELCCSLVAKNAIAG